MIEAAEGTRARTAPRVVEVADGARMEPAIGTRHEGAWCGRRRSRVKLGRRPAEFRRTRFGRGGVEFRRRRAEFARMVEMAFRTRERHGASLEACMT